LDISLKLIYRFGPMRSLSRLQKTFLLVGAALIATALLIPNNKTSIPIIVPDILWDRFSFSPRPEIEVIENNPSSIVFASSIHPQARLTVAKNGDFRNAPKDIVTALCRNEMCTYKAYENRKMDGAVARFQSGEDLQLVLIRSKQKQVWMEYKGPSSTFKLFEPLITELHQQTEPSNQV